MTFWPSKYKRKRTYCCDKPNHTHTEWLQTDEEIEVFQNYTFVYHTFEFVYGVSGAGRRASPTTAATGSTAASSGTGNWTTTTVTTPGTTSARKTNVTVVHFCDLSTARSKWYIDGPVFSGYLLFSLVNPAYANSYRLVRVLVSNVYFNRAICFHIKILYSFKRCENYVDQVRSAGCRQINSIR